MKFAPLFARSVMFVGFRLRYFSVIERSWVSLVSMCLCLFRKLLNMGRWQGQFIMFVLVNFSVAVSL